MSTPYGMELERNSVAWAHAVFPWWQIGSVLFTDFRPPLPPSSKLPETCDWSSTLPETCDWLILCTGRCFWNSIDRLFRATSHDVVRHRLVCLPRTGLCTNTIYDEQLMSQERVGCSCSISCSSILKILVSISVSVSQVSVSPVSFKLEMKQNQGAPWKGKSSDWISRLLKCFLHWPVSKTGPVRTQNWPSRTKN